MTAMDISILTEDDLQEERRGSIAFFTSYRPPVPLDIYSCKISPTSENDDELLMTDGESYNYNGHSLSPAALKTILTHTHLIAEGVDKEAVSGMIMVSERTDNLETLHIAIHSAVKPVRIFNFAKLYGTYDKVRMEDSGCICIDGDDCYLVYVTTKDPADRRRQPWTSVYRTNLKDGQTQRLTPPTEADLSPSVSPDRKRVAMASFQNRGGWNGEIESMKTDIYIMNIKEPFNRKLFITDAGWPTWGSDNVIFFHRKVGKFWAVFRAQMIGCFTMVRRVTPDGIDAVTPVAINSNTVSVVTIRPKLESSSDETAKEPQYRHIEIFDFSGTRPPIEITRGIRPDADHFNPFVIADMGGETRIGYHRCRSNKLDQSHENNIEKTFSKLQCPKSDIGLFRVSGAFPTFSADGSKLAFVDNEFKKVWVADNTGLNIRFEQQHANSVFSTVWNQNPKKDILYVCVGPSFDTRATVDICAILKVSDGTLLRKELTEKFNNAFPSTNPEGTKLVYRSTRDHGGDKPYKNLYIMEDAQVGEFGDGKITRLTEGNWIDTQA
ncbi:uncharacterized protein LOC141656475 [Silene latifolia]|uniref:uncharacterized protein LOC141656475 n=1 Tax=Silene latifolia TaxID=37657 RepID=UPI003D786D21